MSESFNPYKNLHGTEDKRSPRVDSHELWTDEQRMEEFAQTGNAKYLTPTLMQRMQIEIGPDGKPRSTAGPSTRAKLGAR